MGSRQDEYWTVWNDSPKPVLEDTEENCKSYVESRSDDPTLYIMSPRGHEYEFVQGHWSEV